LAEALLMLINNRRSSERRDDRTGDFQTSKQL
jgi:hypothetical protein